MMVLETVFFAITAIITLIFLVQISPTSTNSIDSSTFELKTIGNDALNTIYTEKMHVIGDMQIRGWEKNYTVKYTTNNPTSKLVVCIITNNYQELISSLNSMLPNSVIYNIYIGNGTKTVFLCTPSGFGYDTETPSTMIGSVAISHHPISIDPEFLSGFSTTGSDILNDFVTNSNPYDGATYDVILEMSYLWTK